jgi:hypothetical protein
MTDPKKQPRNMAQLKAGAVAFFARLRGRTTGGKHERRAVASDVRR